MAQANYRPDHARFNFQHDRPLYVKGKALQAGGTMYKRGEIFPWRELGMTPERVANLFPRLVHHRVGAKDEADPTPTSAPQVIKEPSAEDLLNTKKPVNMTVRELRLVSKHIGAPIKRTRPEQLKVVLEHLQAAALS